MRGDDPKAGAMWSYRTPEQRVPADHPLRPVRAMTERALAERSSIDRHDRSIGGSGLRSFAVVAQWVRNSSTRALTSVGWVLQIPPA